MDDKGIDGVVGHNGKYFEIQIKSGKNWNNQRGISFDVLSQNQDRVFIIYNYALDEIRYFTAREILAEPEWKESIRWPMPQIKLPECMLEKYKNHDWQGFLKYMRNE